MLFRAPRSSRRSLKERSERQDTVLPSIHRLSITFALEPLGTGPCQLSFRSFLLLQNFCCLCDRIMLLHHLRLQRYRVFPKLPNISHYFIKIIFCMIEVAHGDNPLFYKPFKTSNAMKQRKKRRGGGSLMHYRNSTNHTGNNRKHNIDHCY